MYEKIITCPNFTWFLPEKSTKKYPKFYNILPKQICRTLHDFCPKSARILHNNCWKNIFSWILGGSAPPISYAYDSVYILLRLTAWKILLETQSLQSAVCWYRGEEFSFPRRRPSWWNHTWWWWRRYQSAELYAPFHGSSDPLYTSITSIHSISQSINQFLGWPK